MTINGGSWSYSGDPSSSTLDQVRFLVGDTDGQDQLLSDEEILWTIGEQGSIYSAAALCCRAIIGSGRLVDKKVGDLEISASQRATQYENLALALERRTSYVAMPYAGGISISDKQSVEDGTDRMRPAFTIGLHDHPANTST